MEISTLKSLTEMGLDHSFLQQWQVGSYNEICPLSMGENYYDMQVSSIPMFNQEQPSSNLLENDFNRPLKQQNTNSWVDSSITEDLFNLKSPATTATATADTHYLAKSNNIPDNESSLMKPKLEIDFSSVSINYPRDVNVIVCPGSVNSHGSGTKRARGRGRGQAQAQDHVLAERKRREKLSQKFIALSALIPGLKRIDKASILGDTIKYLKQLQQRVTTLEEQTKNQTMECVVSVKNHPFPFPFPFPFPRDKHYISSSDEPKKEADTELITQIEAKFSGKDVLIKIYCQKRKNILNKVIAEIDKFPLSIINSTAMSFGSSAFDITIIAQMEERFNMSINEFVKTLDFKIQSLIRNYNN